MNYNYLVVLNICILLYGAVLRAICSFYRVAWSATAH